MKHDGGEKKDLKEGLLLLGESGVSILPFDTMEHQLNLQNMNTPGDESFLAKIGAGE